METQQNAEQNCFMTLSIFNMDSASFCVLPFLWARKLINYMNIYCYRNNSSKIIKIKRSVCLSGTPYRSISLNQRQAFNLNKNNIMTEVHDNFKILLLRKFKVF